MTDNVKIYEMGAIVNLRGHAASVWAKNVLASPVLRESELSWTAQAAKSCPHYSVPNLAALADRTFMGFPSAITEGVFSDTNIKLALYSTLSYHSIQFLDGKNIDPVEVARRIHTLAAEYRSLPENVDYLKPYDNLPLDIKALFESLAEAAIEIVKLSPEAVAVHNAPES